MSSVPVPGPYAAQVRRALADLPASTVDDLLEDLDEHLAEVAAEAGPGVDLAVALGPAPVYADELRRAAGLGSGSTAGRGLAADLRPELRDALERLRRRPAVQEVLAFLPQLQPAWWVLRGMLAVIALGRVFGGSAGWFGTGLAMPVALVLCAAAVVLSVRLGRRGWSHRPGPRAVALAGNALLGFTAVVVVLGGSAQSEVYAGYSDPYPARTTLGHEDGSPITNLFPYTADGRPLSGVLLYDQDGRPVDNLATTTGDQLVVERVAPSGQPPAPGNAYPQTQRLLTYGPDGSPSPVPVPTQAPVSPAPATVTPTPTPTPLPGAPVPTPTGPAVPSGSAVPLVPAGPSPTQTPAAQPPAAQTPAP